MKEKKIFTVRDLIHAAVFTVLCFLFIMVGGFIGFIPYLMPLVPFAASFLTAPAYLLYTTKINKPGMIGIMGAILILFFVVSGHGWYIIPIGALTTAAAEIALWKTDYRSLRGARISYILFSLFTIALLLPIYMTRDAYRARLIEQGYGADYADKLFSVLPGWSFLPVILAGVVGAYLGTVVGIRILKKHFVRAGMMESKS